MYPVCLSLYLQELGGTLLFSYQKPSKLLVLILVLISWGLFWWKYINCVCTIVVEEPVQVLVGKAWSFFPLVISDKTDVSEKVKEAGRVIQQI